MNTGLNLLLTKDLQQFWMKPTFKILTIQLQNTNSVSFNFPGEIQLLPWTNSKGAAINLCWVRGYVQHCLPSNCNAIKKTSVMKGSIKECISYWRVEKRHYKEQQWNKEQKIDTWIFVLFILFILLLTYKGKFWLLFVCLSVCLKT